MPVAPPKRIAAIHDLSGVGKCSLTIALPVISASGVECACMPTAVLSTHTAGFTGYTVRDLSDDLLPMAEHWKSQGLTFDGLYSGWLATPAQGKLLEQIFELLSDEHTLRIVDPVMADNGAYYPGMGTDMCEAFRSLCAAADIITPNVTEACFLTGTEYRDGVHSADYIAELLAKLAELGADRVVLTGVCPAEGKIGNVAIEHHQEVPVSCFYERLDILYHGTGDLFAAALAALLVRGADLHTAMDYASTLVMDSMRRSQAEDIPFHMGVDFERALPAYVAKVAELFG